MSEEILVRLLPQAGDSKQHADTSITVSLPIREAAEEIAAGRAEPVKEIQAHAPLLPSAGLSLANAFQLYVAEHPNTLAVGGLNSKVSCFLVRDYTMLPNWKELAGRSQLGQLADLSFPRKRSGARAIRVEELEVELNRLITLFVLKSVMHRFVKQLQDGALQASGISESNISSLKEQNIPSGWWARDISVQVDKGELRELTRENRRFGVRRWSGIKVKPANTSDTTAKPTIGPIYKTGAAGRPTSMHLVKAELHRRGDEGLTQPTLRKEAKDLAEWLPKTHPDAPPATRKTIENTIRHEYRRIMGKTKPS